MEPAFIGVLGLVLGVILSNSAVRILEALRRRERIQDIRTALRAEIRCQRHTLLQFKEAADRGDIAERFARPSESGATFTPFVPREAPSFVFDAIVGEIHILPIEIIDPVVYYYRQIATLTEFAEDLRSERYLTLEAARKAEMYQDYLAMGVYALALADEAIEAIEQTSITRLRPGRPRDWPRGG